MQVVAPKSEAQATTFPMTVPCSTCGVTLQVDEADLSMSRHSGAYCHCSECKSIVLVSVDPATAARLPKA